ncbi:GTP-binding protein, partial [Nocardioides sp. NPDC057772]|uniref:GTP-binding protein n=1 Tax=Nocardioides sp. NPDC057772 TaxID=3346245 RepID=UPI003671C513
ALVVINKTDLVPETEREETLARIEARVREHNPEVHVAYAVGGRIDPRLVYDAAVPEDPPDELPIAALLREAADDHAAHQHARSVTVTTPGTIEPGRLVDLLEEPPETAYRMKGTVAVATAQGPRSYHVNLVGRSAHVAAAKREPGPASELVAIGLELETDAVRLRLRDALAPAERPSTEGLRRLRQLVRVSL